MGVGVDRGRSMRVCARGRSASRGCPTSGVPGRGLGGASSRVETGVIVQDAIALANEVVANVGVSRIGNPAVEVIEPVPVALIPDAGVGVGRGTVAGIGVDVVGVEAADFLPVLHHVRSVTREHVAGALGSDNSHVDGGDGRAGLFLGLLDGLVLKPRLALAGAHRGDRETGEGDASQGYG